LEGEVFYKSPPYLYMRTIIYLIILLIPHISFGQVNLVPNGNFEEYKWLPTKFLNYDIDSVLIGWNAPTNGTPDYFYKKNTSIPYDALGYPIDWSQYMRVSDGKEFINAQNGKGFGGMGFGVNKNKQYNWDFIGTEFLQTNLSQPIKKNHNYRLKIYYRCSKNTNSKFGQLSYVFTQNELRNKYSTSIDNPYFTRFNPPITSYTNFSGINYDTTWQLFDTILTFNEPKNYLTIGGFNIESHPYTTDTFARFYFFVDNISLVEIPTIIGADTVCMDEVFSLTSTFQKPFKWSADRKGTKLLSIDSIYNLKTNKNGWYYLSAGNGKDSIYLTVVPKPYLQMPHDTTICNILPVRITIKTDAIKILWSTSHDKDYIDLKREGVYRVTCSNNYCSITDSIIVEMEPPACYWAYLLDTLCSEKGEIVEINFPSSKDKYYWLDDKDTSNHKTFDKEGQYDYKVFFGTCAYSYSLIVYDICEATLFIPNAFAPNGINKVFKISVNQLKKSKLMIFNSWGEKIYETYDLNPEWDGIYKNEICPQGNYFYVFEATQFTSRGLKEIYEKGIIFLAR
jgi:gliding motility-associated-like protein